MPDLKGCSSSPLPLVPSGKRIRDEPSSRAFSMGCSGLPSECLPWRYGHAVKYAADQVLFEYAMKPVVGCGNRSGLLSQGQRKGAPEQDEVEMTGVVGEVDALRRIRAAAEPLALGSGQSFGRAGDTRGDGALHHQRVTMWWTSAAANANNCATRA